MSGWDVTIDDGLDLLSQRVELWALPALMVPAVAARDAILANAKAEAPVKTGRFKRGLSGPSGRTGSVAYVSIVDPVGYSTQIHEGETWRSLVLLPMLRLAQQVVAQGPARIVAAIREK